MIQIQNNGLQGYHPQMDGDPLSVEKGYCHFNHQGQKDFLGRMIGYEPTDAGCIFETETFRRKRAKVVVTFQKNNVFRFYMQPEGENICRLNEVFHFSEMSGVKTLEDDNFISVKTDRVTLKFRKCPWEMSIELDGTELTCEQIKDYNVDQKYKAIPTGFTVDAEGKVTDAFTTMYLHCDETFYGFGEKFTKFNKRGQKITIWQKDAQSTNSDSSYKGMPYFISSAGYAVMLNTYSRTHFNMGATSGVSYTMETEDSYLDYYMICNKDYKGLIRDYTALSGRSDMIPRWAFGFWISKMSYMNRAEVENIADKMEKFGMSVDVIHIDGWLDNMGGEEGSGELLNFDEKRFPEPEEMIQKLRQRGLHLSLWMFPYVLPFRMMGEKAVPGNSKLYQNMAQRGFLVKNQAGEPYLFALGEGDGFHVAALDFTNPELVQYMKERVKRLMKMGVGVIKTDFSEEIPEDAVFWDGTTGKESHNKFPLLYAKTIYEASAEAKREMGEKALLWGRSGYLGSQNYPANWAGDSSAALNNLASILNGGLSLGMSGISFWGFDIGGFYNSDDEGNRAMPSDEEYIRSVQMGLMAPLSRSHGQATPREPWEYSEEAQSAFLKINKIRYRLLPYLYSTAWETHREGIPMMRAMLLEFSEDLNVSEISTQYMLGRSLLVAPVFDKKKHMVYFPEGSWIDFYTGKRLTGGDWIELDTPLDQIPLYLRENSMITMLSEAPNHIAESNFTSLRVWINLGGQMEQTYYDDGVEGCLCANLQGDTLQVGIRQMDISEIYVYTEQTPKTVIVNGKEVPFEANDRFIVFKAK